MAAISGRPDGRLAKYIYASGQGGVIDYRWSSLIDMGRPEEAAKIEAKVENGTYRGEEKLVCVRRRTSTRTLDILCTNTLNQQRTI